MKSFQKVGGIAALYEAAAYLAAMVYFLFVIDYPAIVEPDQKVALLVDDRAGMVLLTLLAYVIFGVALVVLALALYERLKAGAPALMMAATAFGLIWAAAVIASGMVYLAGVGAVNELYRTDPAQAMSAWLIFEGVSDALGGGKGEILGGLWTLLVSWAVLRTGGLPRALGYLGVVVGLVGILSVVPALNDIGGLFGMGQLVWFAWLGVVLLRSDPRTAAQPSAVALY
jgi:hypothetical protein